MKINQLKTEAQSRAFAFERATIDEEARTVAVAFSSEIEVERWGYIEVLDHDPKSVRLERLRDGGAVLMDHNHRDQVGVIESVSIDGDRRGRATLRFGRSARASEAWQDVLDNIRRHVSVGYRVHKYEVEERKGAPDRVRITDWEPFEISFVAVPADASVGVGRSAAADQPESKSISSDKGKRTMPEQNQAPAPVDLEAVSTEVRNQERDRVQVINSIGRKFDAQDAAADAISKGVSADEFRAQVLDTIGKRQAKPIVQAIDLSANDKRRYSLMTALRAAMTGDWSKAGFEREISMALADKMGKDARGFYVPTDLFARTLTTAGAATGAELVGTDHLADQFVDALRANTLMGRLGAQFLTGLVGNVEIPAGGDATYYWLAEDEDGTDSDIPTRQIPLSPKTVAGAVPMSRRFLLQSSPSAEAFVTNALLQGLAVEIDRAAFAGSGANGQPKGVLNQTGINTVTAADTTGKIPTFAEMVAMETELALANALMGSLGYVLDPAIAGALKTKSVDTGSGRFVLQDGQVNGYAAYASNQVGAKQSLFGDFSQVIIGQWGVLDLMPDLAAKAASGGMVLRVFQDLDVAIRHPEKFTKVV